VLLELSVENLLLIERARLVLAPGLNVLTGETGAGKTVLAHALDLLLGGRPRAGVVRPGAREACVEGVFALPGRLRDDGAGSGQAAGREGLAPSGAATEVVLARRVGADGRTRAYIDGRSAAVGDLRALAEQLLAFYGQHEHRRLTLASAQLQILDDFCGPAQAERLRACAEAHRQTRELEGELEALQELTDARERELGLLEHELAEIESAAPREGEDEQLRGGRERARRLDALRLATGASAEALSPESGDGPSVLAALAEVCAHLDGVAGLDDQLDKLAERCGGLQIEATDLAGELRDYGTTLEDDEGSLEELEERLQVLERLQRKHGGSIATVLEHAERARARRTELLGAQVTREQVAERLGAAREELGRHVLALRKARRASAPRLTEAVTEQLSALAMGEATFAVEIVPRESSATGGDGVEFSIATNPGVPAGPLRDIASGGELSRVMLAFTTASCGGADVPSSGSRATLVFDEVDAGIGGHTARAVGERLRELARARQVICITHLPQVAALAQRHFSIVKDTSAELTLASVVELEESQTVSELVRMLGAAADDSAARRHAKELRKVA
jgi:DNA repair protein RecN (Recombination protein N)